MGQGLSCVSKKREPDELETKPAKPLRKLKKVKLVDAPKQEVITREDGVEVNDSIKATVNHVVTEAAPAVVEPRRPRLVLHPAAPKSFSVATPVASAPLESASVSPPLKDENFSQPLSKPLTSSTYINQPVDPIARQLAQSDGKYATWKDLYWNLIGSRNLSKDEDKVRAVFSWLCSRPFRQSTFASKEELEEAIRQDVEGAKEALASKEDNLLNDSPEVVLEQLAKEQASYLQAFESLCGYSGIPCRTVRGLAKGVGYSVGMKLSDQLPVSPDSSARVSRLQHAWNVVYLDGKWELFDCMWAAKRLAVATSTRQSQASQPDGKMEYEMDMFYFKADPTKLIYSHFPFDDQWQLLKPPVSLKAFEESVHLKPSFFRHGLGLFSHQQGVIQVQNKLVLKLNISPAMIRSLLFTFNLSFEGAYEGVDHANLTRFGIHEISTFDSTVTFTIRLPKQGAYKLTLYARRSGDQMFSDICEYRVEAQGLSEPKSGTTALVQPFPPTTQSSYGPTEKAGELRIVTVPRDLETKLKCPSGVLDVRFMTDNSAIKLPRMIARLKSLLHDPATLVDCLLIRVVEASLSTTLTSLKSSHTGAGAGVPMAVVTAFLPTPGEYALEVYGVAADADEQTSYSLVWQFLVDAEHGMKLPDSVRQRFATMNLGPQDDAWNKLGLSTLSHSDPLIHIPTVARAGGMQTSRSKSELLQQFVERAESTTLTGSQLTPPKQADQPEQPDQPSATKLEVEPAAKPRDCDLKIVIEKPRVKQFCMVGQLVDISGEEEEDRTSYLLQTIDEANDEGSTVVKDHEQVNYLIRIPKGGRFYKLYLYATLIGPDPTEPIPLVYTYLLEAPARLMSSEVPYIGARWGAFPEKIEQQKAAEKAKLASNLKK